MRDILKKTVAVAMIAGAALAVAACSKTENVNVVENTSMTDTNAMEPMEGSMNDAGAMENSSSNMM